MTHLLQYILVVISLIGSIYCAQCPSVEVVAPCKCLDQTIKCEGTDIVLKRVFKSISNELQDKRKDFKDLILTNLEITELPEHTFADILFENITIVAPKLSSIHIRAFEGTNEHIKSFTVLNTDLQIPDSNHDFFQAISSMKNLEELDISNSKFGDIPKDAFKPLNGPQLKLTQITLVNNKINKIGDLAFYNLPNLRDLKLSDNIIDIISDKSFRIDKSSSIPISIDLSNNKLDSGSFAVGAFESLNRPVTLNFDNNIGMKYLEEKIFKTFLDVNHSNKIHSSKQLDCQDCRSVWLINKLDYTKRINIDSCSSGYALRNSTNFKNCPELIN